MHFPRNSTKGIKDEYINHKHGKGIKEHCGCSSGETITLAEQHNGEVLRKQYINATDNKYLP